MTEVLEESSTHAVIDRAVASGEITADEASEIKDELNSDELSQKLEEEEKKVGESDIRNQLSKMTVAQKIKQAIFGGFVVRGLLIFDSNKIIQECVLKNPRIQLGEIETFLKSTTVSDFVIRSIASTKEWMRAYNNKYLLVANPKTPIDISLKWLRFLNLSDLKKLARSKNIPSALASAASRLVQLADKK